MFPSAVGPPGIRIVTMEIQLFIELTIQTQKTCHILIEVKMKKKVNILFIGPYNSGKSRMANYLANLIGDLPENLQPTIGLRIVEYELNNVQINDNNENIDVQIWDTSGDEKYNSYWPVYRKFTDGIVFVYSQNDIIGSRKLDYMYNFFVNKPNLSPRNCLICGVTSTENNVKLSTAFSKISQITVDLENQKEKFKQDFSKFIISLVNTLNK